MKILLIGLGILLLLSLLGWIGLQIKPASLSSYPQENGKLKTQPLPAGLPTPVMSFYSQLYGDRLPVIESFVITGRAKMRIMGITFPARFRFTHLAGQGYRHYIELTFFGIPIMKVNEYYLDGKGRLELPFGVEEGEKINQGANLALWAESMWMPAIFISDPRPHWQGIDQDTAVLFIPFGEDEQQLIVRFDQQSGMIAIMESMRYKGSDSERKTLWINEAAIWEERDGILTPTTASVTWFDEGTPWAVFTVEDVRYNVDVEGYLCEKGP